MGELVEQRRGKLRVAPAEHRAQHRILEMTQCRIRGDTCDGSVVAATAQPARIALCRFLVEVAAVDHATCDREAPAARLHGELRRCEHVPDHVGTAEVGIAAIRLVVGKAELARGEIPSGSDVFQAAAQLRRRARVRQQLGDRLALGGNLHLSARRLHQVAAGQRQRRGGNRQHSGNSIQ
jgi:hypothetical protein